MDMPIGNLTLPESDFQGWPAVCGNRRKPTIVNTPKSSEPENKNENTSRFCTGTKSISAARILTSPPPSNRKQKPTKPRPNTPAATETRISRSFGGNTKLDPTNSTTNRMLRTLGIRMKRKSQYATRTRTGTVSNIGRILNISGPLIRSCASGFPFVCGALRLYQLKNQLCQIGRVGLGVNAAKV